MIEYNLFDQKAAMEAIFTARIEQGMGLFDMEIKSGISFNSAYAWRSGKRTAGILGFIALATVFGFEVILRNIDTSRSLLEINLTNLRPAMDILFAQRRCIGLSTNGMRIASGVSFNSAYAWRGGKREPAISKLVVFARALGFEIIMRPKLCAPPIPQRLTPPVGAKSA